MVFPVFRPVRTMIPKKSKKASVYKDFDFGGLFELVPVVSMLECKTKTKDSSDATRSVCRYYRFPKLCAS